MSVAAGIMHRVEGQGDNGPATRAAAHGSAACKRRQVARPQRRTVEDVDEAEAAVHLLEVLEELRRPVVGIRARHTRLGPYGQNFDAFSIT